MKFNPIDLERWSRKTHYEFYTQGGECAYDMTKNMYVAELMSFIKQNGYKFYPTFTYIVSKAMNEIMELKIRVDESGKLGHWDYVSPTYPIFHEDDKTFSCIYTEYNDSFLSFHTNMMADMNTFKDIKGICTKLSPKNCFHVSCIPWLAYTGFSLQLYSGNYLAPIVTWGKLEKDGEKCELPLSLHVHHAIADAYHSSLLINRIQELSSNPELLKD